MKVLFVCSANKQRSKTAEDYFKELYPQHHFQSAGTNHKICAKEGTRPLQIEHLIWADHVYVMESRHLEIIRNHLSTIAKDSICSDAKEPLEQQSKGTTSICLESLLSKITVLNIEDIYVYGDSNLVEVLEGKLSAFF